MKLKDIDRLCRDYRREVGKRYGYRQSDYINWKFKEGYFFCLSTNDGYYTELEVKPIFMDDIYWHAIHPDGESRRPDSLRGNGILSSLGQKIWEMSFPEDLRKKYRAQQSVAQYELLMIEVFEQAEKEIESFLRKYPDPNEFDKYLKDHDLSHELSIILLLMNKGDYKSACELAKTAKKQGMRCSVYYTVEENGKERSKHELEFIIECCLAKLG